MNWYILNDDGVPVRENNPIKVYEWDNSHSRVMARDCVGDIEVSTVFLMIDISLSCDPAPILFETMVFGSPDEDERTRRYSTKEEALKGHAEALAEVRKLMEGK